MNFPQACAVVEAMFPGDSISNSDAREIALSVMGQCSYNELSPEMRERGAKAIGYESEAAARSHMIFLLERGDRREKYMGMRNTGMADVNALQWEIIFASRRTPPRTMWKQKR